MPKHPEINIELAGQDGNAFSILGRVIRAMRKAGLSNEEIVQFQDEATSSDYENLLITVMEWVSVDEEDDEEDDDEWEYNCDDHLDNDLDNEENDETQEQNDTTE